MFLSVDEYIASLLTRSEVMGFLSEVEELRESVYKTEGQGLEQTLRTGIGARSAEVLLAQLIAEGKLGDIGYLEKFFAETADELRHMPVVNLELANEPTRELLTKIKNKISEFIGQQAMIDYKVDAKLMAGARVAYEGKYLDVSLSSRWPEVWREVKDKVLTKHDS